MRADLLRDHFETLIRTPEDVETIEVTVLKMAMQGKLVPQNPNDKPVKLAHKRAARHRKAQSNESGTTRGLLPPGWDRASLGEVFELQYGKGLPKKARDSAGSIPVYGSNGVIGHHSESLVDTECIVVGRKGSAGAVNLSLEPCWVIDTAYYVVPPDGLDLRFTFYLLRSLGLDELSRGIKPGLSRRDAYEIELSIPPLAEQKRIVARVDEIVTKAHRLAETLETTDHLLKPAAQASFRALVEAPDAVARQEAWQRVLDGFEVLTSDSRTIDVLKQTILDLAVRGMLVPQDPQDEPASVLLKRFAQSDRMADGVQQGELSLASTTMSMELPELPLGWEWTKLAVLLSGITAGRSPKARKRPAQPGEAGVLKVSAVSWELFQPQENKALYATTEMEGVATVHKGDLLISRANTAALVGAVVLAESDYEHLYLSDKTLRLDVLPGIHRPFLMYALRAPWVRSFYEEQASGTSSSMKNLSQAKILATPIALPPVQEQERIACYVSKLMEKCDQLTRAVELAEHSRERLFQSTLNGTT